MLHSHLTWHLSLWVFKSSKETGIISESRCSKMKVRLAPCKLYTQQWAYGIPHFRQCDNDSGAQESQTYEWFLAISADRNSIHHFWKTASNRRICPNWTSFFLGETLWSIHSINRETETKKVKWKMVDSRQITFKLPTLTSSGCIWHFIGQLPSR